MMTQPTDSVRETVQAVRSASSTAVGCARVRSGTAATPRVLGRSPRGPARGVTVYRTFPRGSHPKFRYFYLDLLVSLDLKITVTSVLNGSRNELPVVSV